MSLRVKEEPEWEVPCESEHDGLVDVKIVKVEVVIEPGEPVVPNQECSIQVPSVKKEPACSQDPLWSEEGPSEEPVLESRDTSQPQPTCTSSSDAEKIICAPTIGACLQWHIPQGCAVKQTQKPQQKYTCETCKKEFTRINNLRTHQKTHTRKTPYCKICKREFRRQSNLTTHNKRIHSGDKPYSCAVCSKDFKEQYVLNRHMRIHTGEKPYGCEICGRTFAILNHLKEHRRVHTDDKPFTCDLCSKQFKHKYTLKCHIIHHTGEKPHTCDICFKKFIRSTDLKEHLSSHAETKPFSCEQCKAEFSRKDTFYRHVKRRSCRGSGRPLKNRD